MELQHLHGFIQDGRFEPLQLWLAMEHECDDTKVIIVR